MKVSDFINDFLDAINKAQTNGDDELTVDSLEIKEYVPYVDKVSICKGIAESSSYEEVTDRKVFKANSPSRYLLYIMRIIDEYTNIDISEGEEFIREYDELCKVGAIEYIQSMIPERELKEFQVVMNMTMDDLYDNVHSPAASLMALKDAIYAIGDGLLSGFQASLQNMIEQAEEEGLDVDQS